MPETNLRLLSKPCEGYPNRIGGKRQEFVTREEWEALFKPFPANVRAHMANLAAHNWHIVYDGERVGALGPSSYDGHWMHLDGSRVEMSEEEQNSLFPVAPLEKKGWNDFANVWPKRGPDGAYRGPIIRQRDIVIPSSATSTGTAPHPADGGENGT